MAGEKGGVDVVREAKAPLCCDLAGACVVIPVFNHGGTVGAVVAAAREHASTVLVVDDGSTDGSGDAAERAGGIVLRHGKNRGKGAALQTLFAEAERRGFRLAVSLDADGQHQPSDIPKLLAVALEAPDAITIGARDQLAAGAPARNDFGRRASNWWLWFETGEDIPDSQSGFRVYPLALTRKLGAWRSRYDFEMEVLLKAAWAGLALRATPISVLYPKDRITHLIPYWDLTRITFVNVLACFRMLLPLPLGRRLRPLPHLPGRSLFAVRTWFELGGTGPGWRVLAAALGVLPALSGHPKLGPLGWLLAAVTGAGAVPAALATFGFRAWHAQGPFAGSAVAAGVITIAFALGLFELATLPRREPSKGRAAKWTGRSRGGVFGHWFMVQLTRGGALKPAYLIVYPVTLYFLFAAPAARRGSAAFLARVKGPASPLKRLFQSYQHLLSFARMMVDRSLMWNRGASQFHCVGDGLHHIEAAAADGKGVVLLTAHLGNWALASQALATNVAEKLTVVAFQGEDAQIARYLDRAQGPRPKTVAASTEPLAGLELLRELRAGRLLAFQGDRVLQENFISVPFLGREARFPVGPYRLAAASGSPVIATFSVQVGPADYRFVALPPMRVTEPRGPARDAQVRRFVETYVAELERLARAYPYQWFNFYDFWEGERPRGGAVNPAGAAVESDGA